jgi:glycosyltransferase involved in cell wall biosynthesis
MEPYFALSFEGRLSQELRATGVPLYHLGNVRTSRPWTVWQARRKLQAVFSREQFDVMICHMTWPLAVFGPVAKPSARLVFWMHGGTAGRHWLDRWAGTVEPDLAICNSHFTASSLPNIFPGMPSEIINYPVNLGRDDLSIDVRARIRHQSDTPDDALAIIQVSRMESWKGHLLHLQALALLKDLSGWICWFVGGAQRPEEQNYVRRLQQTAAKLGISERVRFLGSRSDIPDLLAAADVFCQPNQRPEPFGIVFIEALLAGLPVIATAMGGAQEIVDKSCGMLVPPGNAAALADCLRQMIESEELRLRLGERGPARAKSLCDPETQLAHLREALAN